MTGKSAIVIGSGFAGLSAASFLARDGWKVTVIEKHDQPGGRARQLVSGGFTFDRGPSFYWMPDVFERYFRQFGKNVSDYYSLTRLDPSYRVYWNDSHTDLPADFKELLSVFESMETGSGKKLESFLEGARYKYQVGMNKLVYKPALSWTEFLDWETITGVFRLSVFSSIRSHIHRYFKDPRIRQLMEFPVLFLGALPENTPALYSLMNYADIRLGTWYPEGGMYAVVKGMHRLAEELGVEFRFNEEAIRIEAEGKMVKSVVTDKNVYPAHIIVSGADYHFTEHSLLNKNYRQYSPEYWEKRTMAPSCLMYYVGLNKKLKHVKHHSLFFDVPFHKHGEEIYKDPKWPNEPLFYMSVSSKTDGSVAPTGHENLVFLIPVASGLTGDNEALREKYFQMIVRRLETHLGEPVENAITFRQSYAVSDFINDYHAFRGNAYGLASTLKQTAIFRPACQSRKLKNLFFTGQLTVPGPGVPPSLISGEVVAKLAEKKFG